MRKISAIILSIIVTASTAFAAYNNRIDNDTPITYSELPDTAKNFISKNFAKEQVTHVTLDKDIISNEYKVVFASGTKLEFDGDGDWKELDCRYGAVPANLIPAKIADYVKSNYPNSKIVELKREHGNWEVKISGGLELTFSNKFKLVDIDD